MRHNKNIYFCTLFNSFLNQLSVEDFSFEALNCFFNFLIFKTRISSKIDSFKEFIIVADHRKLGSSRAHSLGSRACPES